MHALRAAYYGGIAAALALILLRVTDAVLPGHAAKYIAENTEALVYAALVGLAIDLLRPRGRGRANWAIVATVAVAELVIGWLLVQAIGTSVSPRIATLNEGFLAAAVVTPFVVLRRPVRWAGAVGLALLTAIVVFNRTDFVTQQAESVVMVALAPLAFDVFDRLSLDPAAPATHALRAGFWVAMIAIPLFFSLLQDRAPSGLLGEFSVFGSRVTEAFFGTLLVLSYCALRPNAPERARRGSEIVG